MAATDRTRQILPGGQSAAPFDYPIPASLLFNLLAVRAVFDGSGASGSFLPVVQLWSDAGELMGQSEGSAVAAGGSADVTFAPFLDAATAESCCDTAASGYGDVVLSTNPRGFWKLNESAGAVAADSSGNGYDLTVTSVGPVGAGTWAWAQAAGPPGDQTVHVGGAPAHAANGAMPAHTDNFAAGVWVNVDTYIFLSPPLMRQGDPENNTDGWSMRFTSGGQLGVLFYGGGVQFTGVISATVHPTSTWMLCGWQRNNGVNELYFNGSLVASNTTADPGAAGGVDFVTDNADGFYLKGYLSWSFLWDRPLTAAEWAALATPGGVIPSGWVLTSDGSGSASYAPLQSGSATAGWKLYADGSGGTYWAP